MEQEDWDLQTYKEQDIPIYTMLQMVTFPSFYVARNYKQILLKVRTLAKDKVVGYNKILTYLQLLNLPSQFDHQSRGDKLNLDSKGCLGIETLPSKT